MDLLAGLLTGSLHAGTPGPADDWWYSPVGTMTTSGLRIDAAGAQKISAWYRGRDILATSLAMLPLITYRRLPNNEGREPAPAHPLYDVLHRRTNHWQDAFQYRREAMFDVIDHGWHVAEIVPGPRGIVDQLQPIAPALVTPEQIASGPRRGRWLFQVRDQSTGQTTTLTQDEVFFLRGAGGKGILEHARESLGLGVVLESYASRLFSRGAMSGGIIQTPGPVTPEAMTLMARSFKTAAGDWHMPRVLTHGATFVPSMMEPEKAQMILSRRFTVVDIARWLGLPAHMLNEVDTAGVTGLEQKGQEFVTFSLGGWLSMWEFGINDQLILRPETYFAEFTRDALARGALAERWEAYVSSTNAGIRTRNEVRRLENLRALPGLDTPLDPQNITGRGARGGPQDNQRPGRAGDGQSAEARETQAQAIAGASAARLLRKEIAAVQKLAVKWAADADGFAVAVTAFYAGHSALVAQTLQMSPAAANDYCSQQAAQILGGDWLAAITRWRSPEYATGFASLAMEAT